VACYDHETKEILSQKHPTQLNLIENWFEEIKQKVKAVKKQ